MRSAFVPLTKKISRPFVKETPNFPIPFGKTQTKKLKRKKNLSSPLTLGSKSPVLLGNFQCLNLNGTVDGAPIKWEETSTTRFQSLGVKPWLYGRRERSASHLHTEWKLPDRQSFRPSVSSFNRDNQQKMCHDQALFSVDCFYFIIKARIWNWMW